MFRKMPAARRTIEDVEEYSKSLDKTCVLWPDDAL